MNEPYTPMQELIYWFLQSWKKAGMPSL